MKKNNGISILGTGSALPKKYITNEDLSQFVDTSDEWIRSRTGIKSRYKCRDGEESCVTLAVEAGKKAIEKAEISYSAIGLIIVATSSSDYILPSVASLVHKELGMKEEVMCFDLSAACTGFLYGLGAAKGILASMPGKYGLVIGSEQLSKIIDYSDRGTCILFGDGAGAAVIDLSDNIYYQKSWTRGDINALACPGIGRGNEHVTMDGHAVFRFAVKALEQGIQNALEANNVTMSEIDFVVCHQANLRIIEHVKKRYKEFKDKFFINIEKLGNTSAASIAIALDEMYKKNLLHSGSKIILVGFGAGLTWSCVYMEV